MSGQEPYTDQGLGSMMDMAGTQGTNLMETRAIAPAGIWLKWNLWCTMESMGKSYIISHMTISHIINRNGRCHNQNGLLNKEINGLYKQVM